MKLSWKLPLLLVSIIFMSLLSITAQSDLALTTTILNGRSGPDVAYDIVVQYPHASTISVNARNEAGNWLFVRAVDTGIEAWVTTTYINLPDGLDIMALPVRAAGAPQAARPVQEETVADAPPAEQAVSQPVVAAPPAGSRTGTTITMLNVRTGPSAEDGTIGSLAANTPVIIENRNRIGNWILVHAADGSIRGWVASRYVDFAEGLTLESLIVSTEIIGASQGEQMLFDFDPEVTVPQGASSELIARLDSIPVFMNFGSHRVPATFRLGQAYGNRPNVFMKVGDSVTDSQPFMLAYGQGGGYDLGSYSYLQETINHFAGVAPRDGVTNSFTNRSFAAITGATSASMLDGLWADPSFCAGESPLSCEIKLTRPSVGFVLFGTQDMRVLTPEEFRIHLSQITDSMMASGVIPVLSTFHSTESYYPEEAAVFNNIIVDVAQHYEVPLINLWKATQPLPTNGVNLADPVHLTQGVDNYYNFTGEETRYGVNVRNLLSLQALDNLRHNILLR